MDLPDSQNYIISKLKNARMLRYRSLKPEGISNDLFNYHLKALVSKKIVQKVPTGYALSEKGQAYVADKYNANDMQPNRLFKINVITIVSRVDNGRLEVLNQRRNSQPSYGIVDVPGGTIMKGEDLLEGARRKLKDETGLEANFRLLGFERRRLYKEGKLFSDVIFPICYADSYEGELASTKFGQNFWVPINQAYINTRRPFDSIASIAECLSALRDGTLDSLGMFYKETEQRKA